MTLSSLFRRRVVRRSPAAGTDRGIVLVVALMMGLVFAPVLGLHVAAKAFGPPDASAAAGPTAVGIAAQPKARPGPV